jgi:hypothetical protein
MLGSMPALLGKLRGLFRREPKSPEDIAAEAEAKRVQDLVQDTRLSQRAGSAGENYQSGRGTR